MIHFKWSNCWSSKIYLELFGCHVSDVSCENSGETKRLYIYILFKAMGCKRCTPCSRQSMEVAWNCDIHLTNLSSNLETRPLAFQKGPNEPILAELEHFLTPPPECLKFRCSSQRLQKQETSCYRGHSFWNRQTHKTQNINSNLQTPLSSSQIGKLGPECADWGEQSLAICRTSWTSTESYRQPSVSVFPPKFGEPQKNIRLKP